MKLNLFEVKVEVEKEWLTITDSHSFRNLLNHDVDYDSSHVKLPLQVYKMTKYHMTYMTKTCLSLFI